MSNVFEDTTKAFDISLMQFGQANSIVIALENINAPTDVSTPYLDGTIIPAPTQQADLYFSEQYDGVYQIDINYATNLGSAPINKMADLLRNHFKAGTLLNRNGLCIEVQSVDIGPLIRSGGWATRPLSVNYTLFTERL